MNGKRLERMKGLLIVLRRERRRNHYLNLGPTITAEELCALTGLTDRRHRQLARVGYFPPPLRAGYERHKTIAGLYQYFQHQVLLETNPWYLKNRETILASRRKRYQMDPAYRAMLLLRRRGYKKNNYRDPEAYLRLRQWRIKQATTNPAYGAKELAKQQRRRRVRNFVQLLQLQTLIQK